MGEELGSDATVESERMDIAHRSDAADDNERPRDPLVGEGEEIVIFDGTKSPEREKKKRVRFHERVEVHRKCQEAEREIDPRSLV